MQKEPDMAQFDALGGVYERTFVDIPFREYVESYSVRQVIGDVVGRTVLDLGCGSGVYSRLFARWGAAQVVGIDVSEGMLATARAAEPPQSRNVEYLWRDATHLDPRGDTALDGRFDLVASVYVLCYAADENELAGFFTTARRAIAPTGGRLVATTLNPDYDRGAEYYAGYNFEITQPEEGEGTPVTLHATMADGQEFNVTTNWWSRRTYEWAAAQAGFGNLSWISPTVADQGVEKFGHDYWARYLNAPHAVILEAVAEPSTTTTV
jgi:SAM-dependent methyltransferase